MFSRFGRVDTHGWGIYITKRDWLYLDVRCGTRTYWIALWRLK